MTDGPDDVGNILVSVGEGGRVLVRVAGEVDISNVDEFRHAITDVLADDADVVFDLAAVSFMDTSGLALLIDVTNTTATCVLHRPSDQVRRVIEASGLGGVLRVEP